MTTDEILAGVLQREGWPTYTNLASDRGGPTKGGITLDAWREFTGNAAATIADLQAVTETQAQLFYRKKFVTDPKFDQIADDSLRELLIDAAVNHGSRHPIKWVQWAAEVTQDGSLGPVSIAAINAAAPQELFLWVCAFRVRLYGRLTSGDPELTRAKAAGFHLQAEFTAGWCNRVAEFLEAAARRIEADHKRGADHG